MEVLTLYIISQTLHVRTLQEELRVYGKALGSNLLFPSINALPSWHAGQSVSVACHVSMPWVATIPFSQIICFGEEMPCQYYFSVSHN